MNNIPIVGIGASAGGLKEFELFFKNMPSTGEAAFVIIQHLAPNHKSILADIVNRYSEMDTYQIENDMTVQAGKVYIIPPNNLVLLKNDRLFLEDLSDKRGVNLPIDVFFRSLKENNAERSVAVILSGTGSDGTLGIKEVKEAGGLTIVQQPDTAEYDGMLTSAIRTGLIDYIIPVAEMPGVILNYIENEFQQKQIITANEKTEKEINQVFNIIKDQIGHDFTNYKRNTIFRRIERRLTVNKLDNLAAYIRLLRKDSAEVVVLYKELLISVTNFFRDSETFGFIEKTLIPKIISANRGESLRVWVPACATGEEAYSWALMLKNYIDDNKLNIDLQVFASDIDLDAIEKAREGLYTGNIVSDVPEHLLERYFQKEKGGYRIKKSVRESVIFAEQNLIQDPPYSKLDIISCRNLLIYLDNYLQHKAVSIFHYALNSAGYLILGNSESLGSSAQFYEVVDRKNKIFQKIDSTEMAPKVWNMNYDKQVTKTSVNKILQEPVSETAKEFILEKFAPPGVVIDNQGTMIFAQGKTGRYLEITTGDITNNITKMAKDGIKIPLSNAIRKAKSTNSEVTLSNIKIGKNENDEYIDIIVSPLRHNQKETKLFMVVFKTVKPVSRQIIESSVLNSDTSVIIDLEKELAEKEQYLQSTIEELETTNEELKSSNEEAQSTNEELQSTNEELETSKEELQSVNEELTTTNTELSLKLDELNKANSQLINLLSATEIATIFLDRDLRIFNFTPAVSIITDLLHTDIGRSIKQFTNNLKYENLIEDIKDVLKTLIPREFEVETNDDKYFWMRILPYRTIDDKIEGVVLTFTDITERVKAEQALKESENRFRQTLKNSSIVVFNQDKNLRYTWVYNPNPGFNPRDTIGKTDHELLPEKDADRLTEIKQSVLDSGVPRKEEVTTTINGQSFYYDLSVEVNTNRNEEIIGVSCVSIDITDRVKAELALKESEEKYRETYENAPDSIIIHDFDMNIIDVNQKAVKEFGYTKKEFLKLKVFDLHSKDELPHSEEVLGKMQKQKTLQVETRFQRKDGSIFFASATPCKYKLGGKPIIHVVIRNIDEHVKTRDELIKYQNHLEELVKEKSKTLAESEKKFRSIFEKGLSAIVVTDDEGNCRLVNNAAAELFGYTVRELLNMKVSDLQSGDEQNAGEQYRKYLKKGEESGEFEFFNKKGKSRTAIYRAIRVQKDFNISMLFDISELKITMQELNINQMFLKRAQEIGRIGTWHLDLKTNILSWTKENYRIFGVKENAPINYELFLERVHPDDREYVDSEWKNGIKNNSYDIEHRLAIEGSPRWVREKAEFIPDENGNPKEAFGVTQDISIKKEYELKLKEYADDLNLLNQDKDDFISILAHDLKNHLNGLVGVAGSILDDFDRLEKTRLKDYLKAINDTAVKTKNLLLQTLQWANPETNVMDSQETHFKPADVISVELDLLLPMAKNKSIEIINKVDSTYDLFMNKGIFDVVIRNLISNAIKFTGNDGRIIIDARKKADQIVFSISDTGVGMSKAEIDKLFKISSLSRNTGTNDEEGTGLGLRICSKLLKAIDSSIEVQSKPGKGSTFSFSIPLDIEFDKQ